MSDPDLPDDDSVDVEAGRVISVLVVDDHRSFGEAIGIAVDVQDDLTCLGVAATLSEGLRMVDQHRPDVVLMDVRLPDGDGIEGTRLVKERAPATDVLVLTAHTDLEVMTRAATVGASGFLPKETPVADVLHAIRTAASGAAMLVEATALGAILQQIRDPQPPVPTPDPGATLGLTQREREILGLLGEGMDPKTIARNLEISVHTCRGHVKSILAKLNVHSQLEAVVVAARQGLLPGFAG